MFVLFKLGRSVRLSKDKTTPVGENVALLNEAADRHLSAELQHTKPSGEICSSKTRVLVVDDEHLYLDIPISKGKNVAVEVDWVVDVHIRINRQMFAFQSKVVRIDSLIRLNSQKTVRGIQITKPSVLKETQRRNNYRVSTASMAPIDATILDSGSTEADAEALLHAEGISTRLINLSCGGCGVVLPVDIARGFQSGGLIFVRFELPDESLPFLFQTKICQVAAVLEGQAFRMGLQFVQWPDPVQYKRMLRPLEKFIADAQRAEARRINPRRQS